ncbi:putative protein (some members containing a von Willebrand factor type A (vWA) domain) [Rubellimicrobium thermophilum DSM 16684]|uniref:DUF58 domain-containing protein n=1 Tax=Rubellimicrobium thermophilum DSM 16684 TaxID=1123069 RepID=S9SBQ4_9RHOB|nr:VWA domain-containing protein [Rubellimicrobium thermophilum]EPX87555.1 putative protein (some members containing a von Willebrand factor type A (vWA) domain) [Rubellimicrobium thermophilum DSM 16684]
MSAAPQLRAGAETLAAPLPALLVEASRLAAAVTPGEHGRRRPGQGSDFWQYRLAQPGDPARAIDWRRSARSDMAFVQDKEWQIAQTVTVWADRGRSMDFASSPKLPTKAQRARLLAMAAAVLLVRGGERVGLPTEGLAARRGPGALARLAERLSAEDPADYAVPEVRDLPPRSRALFISDFLGDLPAIEGAVTAAAARGVVGALLQILDPQEEAFPFTGRTIFESIGGSLRHETLKARDLRGRYLDRLAARKARLADLARRTGWRLATHRTDSPALRGLLWIHGALERQNR